MTRRHTLGPLTVLIALAALLWLGSVEGASAQFPQTCSVKGCLIDMSPSVYVLNNHWNTGTASGGQSITVNSDTSWSTSWDFDRSEDWTVTTYAAAIFGWQWGWRVPPAQLGLPVQLSSRTPINTTAVFDYVPDSSCGGSRVCRLNVSYDVWFHRTASPDTSNPAYEMMIWLAYSRELFSGYRAIGYATIGGHRWKVIESQGGSSPVGTFLLDEPADLREATLDIMEFAQWLVDNHGLPADWWLDSVQFGPEVFKGKGTLNVHGYGITVGGAVSPAPAPSPSPTPASPSFTAGIVSVNPSPALPGQGVAITAPVTSATAMSGVLIDLEVYNGAGTRVAQKAFSGQSFSAGQTRTYSWTWPGSATAGTFTVKVGVFSNDWSTLYLWRNAAATITVTSSTGSGDTSTFAVTSTTISPTSVIRGGRVNITTSVRSSGTTSAIVDLELYNAAGTKVGQRFCNLSFSRGQTRSCSWSYVVPSSLPSGRYTVKVGVFSTNWNPLYVWVDRAGVLTVR